ncbi:hypothetical protein MJO29_014922 [Puccinia striiformis f. sp. tritici]|nr:hypothetical protein MJO29_014922 [Puccinia striiformis f. sp. tritici]
MSPKTKAVGEVEPIKTPPDRTSFSPPLPSSSPQIILSLFLPLPHSDTSFPLSSVYPFTFSGSLVITAPGPSRFYPTGLWRTSSVTASSPGDVLNGSAPPPNITVLRLHPSWPHLLSDSTIHVSHWTGYRWHRFHIFPDVEVSHQHTPALLRAYPGTGLELNLTILFMIVDLSISMMALCGYELFSVSLLDHFDSSYRGIDSGITSQRHH